MSFGPGALNASAVWVGTTPATAVYLGTEKVWPSYTPQQSQWYKPTTVTGSAVMNVICPWPAGAEFVDVIIVGGGAGGTGTGIGGNPQLGGGAGQWEGFTIPRTGEMASPYIDLSIQWGVFAGSDGIGGGNFNTEAADGSYMQIWPRTATSGGTTQQGPLRKGKAVADKTSNTGNRNGGNVAPTFTYNGRTYTLASYGAGAGQGGATSNKNGGPGNAPGGGGQSADNGGLTGYNGGNGAHGAFILYWY